MPHRWSDSLIDFMEAAHATGAEILYADAEGRRCINGKPEGASRWKSLFSKKPQSVCDAFGPGRSLDPDELAIVASHFAGNIPAGLREFLDVFGARGYCMWTFPDPPKQPPPFDTAYCGGIEWMFNHGFEMATALKDWIEGIDDADVHPAWRTSVGLFPVGNGDVWAIDTNPKHFGRVLYFDHEQAGIEPILLGPDLATVMDHWTRLGCVGPESWILEPYLDPRTGINASLPSSRNLRAAIGLKD
jgi:hypothetical protein